MHLHPLTEEEFHEIFLRQTAAVLPCERAEELFAFLVDPENQEDISVISKFFER